MSDSEVSRFETFLIHLSWTVHFLSCNIRSLVGAVIGADYLRRLQYYEYDFLIAYLIQ